MQLDLLLSCMNQPDWQIAKRSNITGNVLIINQCPGNSHRESITENAGLPEGIRMITVSERGLSRSRNMAIENAKGDICLFCDDDELFTPGYERMILQAFEALPQADLIAFDVDGKKTRLPHKVQKLGFTGCLKLASYQIAFRREAIVKKRLFFDVHMGAGSGNGCGEENKFLLDCRKAGLSIYYVPETIAKLRPQTSTWFFGFNRDFFYQRGAATRHMMGLWLSCFYGCYYIAAKWKEYRTGITPFQAGLALFKGIFENPIRRQILQEEGGSTWRK